MRSPIHAATVSVSRCLVFNDLDHGRRSVEDGHGSAPALGKSVNVGNGLRQQAVGLRPDLVRGAVVDPQRVRPAAYINAERLPRKRRLEDALAKIASEKQAIRPPCRKRREKTHRSDAQVLRLIGNDKVEGPHVLSDNSAVSRAKTPGQVINPRASSAARRALKIAQSCSRCFPPILVLRPRRGYIPVCLPALQVPGINDIRPFVKKKFRTEAEAPSFFAASASMRLEHSRPTG